MKINKQKKKNFTIIAIAIATLLLVGGGVAAYMVMNNQNKADSQEINDVNYDPPTDREVEEGQDAKKDAYENTKNPSSDDKTTTETKKSVNVGVSFADMYDGKLEIRAFTSGVVEAGTCTATVKRGGEEVTKTSGAFIDASSTQCEPMYIPKSELSSGKWSVTVSFSSKSALGTSEVVEVNVP